MKRALILGAALIAMIAGPAVAADMPVKAVPPPPVLPSWTGTYVGLQVGTEWGHSDWNPTCIDAGGGIAGGCGSALSLATFPGAPDSAATFNTRGTRYGLYYGWMFQAWDRWVFGAEGDYARHTSTGSVPFIVGCATAACTGGFLGAGPFFGDSTSLKLGDDYSFRVRAGFLVMPQLQIYGTAGAAVQRVAATVVCNPNTGAACNNPPTILTSTSTDSLVGYTVGAGIEWKAWDHLLVRGEYRYNDYGTWKQTAFLASGQIEELANVHVKSQMATVGIAWLFGVPRW
jgi:outer membrane immunogenic protein